MRVAGVSEDGEQPVEEERVEEVDDEAPTPLRHFLSTSMLSTDADTQDSEEERRTPKVTISTCHAAKGLEWPVVFVPAGELASLKRRDPPDWASGP